MRNLTLQFPTRYMFPKGTYESVTLTEMSDKCKTRTDGYCKVHNIPV